MPPPLLALIFGISRYLGGSDAVEITGTTVGPDFVREEGILRVIPSKYSYPGRAPRMSGSSIGDNSTHSKILRQLKIVTTPLGFMSIVA